MTPDHPDVGVLFDALREGRREPELLKRFDVAWADDLGVDECGLWVCVAGIRLRWIRPSRFMMGSPLDEEGRLPHEGWQQAEIHTGFWLGETPVTQAQWMDIMGDNPSQFPGDDRPVERVSWEDCQAFLRRLPACLAWRLPSESEWESACRAGTTGPRWSEDLDGVAWFEDNCGGESCPVGHKAPNPWGLHDMLGNVWEWCADATDVRSPPAGRQEPEVVGSHRVFRGGSWLYGSPSVRAACRLWGVPKYSSDDVGVRVAADPGRSGV
ncbi:MAG: formylglycine-generating enzyme family protein [Myxococcales bacterium]|nr:formylglycine-generating enzyme family protein [Myxococcales bacterium]